MRRFLNAAAIVGALSLSGVSAAQGTAPDFYPMNMSFRLGGVFPLDDRLDDLGNSLFAFGIDYRLSKPLLPNGETFVSLDWFFGSTTGQKGNVLPLNLNHKWYTSQEAAEGAKRTYVFLGVGAVFIDLVSSDTVFGARVGAGMELSTNVFVEGTFFISDRASGNVRSNAFGAYIGYRF